MSMKPDHVTHGLSDVTGGGWLPIQLQTFQLFHLCQRHMLPIAIWILNTPLCFVKATSRIHNRSTAALSEMCSSSYDTQAESLPGRHYAVGTYSPNM